MKVEGYFSGIKTANEVVEKLKLEGFRGAFADINEHRNNAYAQKGAIGSEDVSSLSNIVLGDSGGNGSGSPLAAASPMASGMGGFEEVADINCKVVVEVSEENKENVENIIRSMGGTTDNPNSRIPGGLENIGQGDLILKNLED
jgi:hypothetical protein